MVVSITPNLGLVKPSETELSKDWVELAEYQEDNNLQLIDKLDINLQSRNPIAIRGHSSNPSVGAGSAKLEFVDVEGIVMGTFNVQFLDPGISVGSGEYGFELPFELNTGFHTVGNALNVAPGPNSVIGNGYIYDSSAVATCGGVALDAITLVPGSGVSYARMITEVFTSPAKTSRLVTNAQPFTPANGDCFSGFFIFKKA